MVEISFKRELRILEKHPYVITVLIKILDKEFETFYKNNENLSVYIKTRESLISFKKVKVSIAYHYDYSDLMEWQQRCLFQVNKGLGIENSLVFSFPSKENAEDFVIKSEKKLKSYFDRYQEEFEKRKNEKWDSYGVCADD